MRLITLGLLAVLLSGCQLIEPYTEVESKFGQYYVQLKALSDEQLLVEVNKKKQQVSEGNIESQVNLILLYSLPNSPIHNAYTAKSLLNDIADNQLSLINFSRQDVALITLLRDQLNQQLLLFQQLIVKELAQEQDQLEIKKQQVTKQQLEHIIVELNQKVGKLIEQIEQLKIIESAISERGN